MLDVKTLIDKVLTFIKPKTGTITASSNFTLSEVNVVERCGVVSINGYATRSSAIGTSQIKLGQLNGVSYPRTNVRMLTGTGTYAYAMNALAYIIITTSGEIFCTAKNTSDRVIIFDFSYNIVGGGTA